MQTRVKLQQGRPRTSITKFIDEKTDIKYYIGDNSKIFINDMDDCLVSIKKLPTFKRNGKTYIKQNLKEEELWFEYFKVYQNIIPI